MELNKGGVVLLYRVVVVSLCTRVCVCVCVCVCVGGCVLCSVTGGGWASLLFFEIWCYITPLGLVSKNMMLARSHSNAT